MSKLKILVVDDESRMRKLVKDFLVKHDYEVLEAQDGEQAVDIFFEDKDIALVILDVMMPKMDGWQVCREIRAHSKVPIIMLTAKGEWTSIFPSPSVPRSWWPGWRPSSEEPGTENRRKSWRPAALC